MTWRVLLTVSYAAVLGVLMTLENLHPGMSGVPLFVAWIAAPLVGFAVGRWWVLLVVAGLLAGRTIGWDSGENDGNPALWPPYVIAAFFYVGLPLLLGVLASLVWTSRRRHSLEHSG